MRPPLAAPLPCIVIAGPTGTGKSALALRVAEALDGVIINADSRQVYTDFPIITAQPDARAQGRVPHALYGFLGCMDKLSAGAYAELAEEIVRAMLETGKTPILVGGTGLYLRTILSGIAPIPQIEPEISLFWQEKCEKLGAPALHALLAEHDPQTAARLHPNDSQRILRALEVLRGTGKPLSWWHAQPVPPSSFSALSFLVDMPLAAIEPRLEKRVDAMIAAGAVREAENALTLCDDPEAPGWSGIGCAELFKFITGKTDFATCRSAWIHNTRAYAKRQITWFKRETGMLRYQPGNANETDDIIARSRKFITESQYH
ncbi:MAG: tRNA dimethylallyltransferase [Desulfovibrio sp.]